jgi:hypothetical protein
MADKSYAVLQNPRTNATRLSWSSHSNGNLYCGICLRGLIETEVGHVCLVCQSRVQQVFEVINGGKPMANAGARRTIAAHRSTAETSAKVRSL